MSRNVGFWESFWHSRRLYHPAYDPYIAVTPEVTRRNPTGPVLVYVPSANSDHHESWCHFSNCPKSFHYSNNINSTWARAINTLPLLKSSTLRDFADLKLIYGRIHPNLDFNWSRCFHIDWRYQEVPLTFSLESISSWWGICDRNPLKWILVLRWLLNIKLLWNFLSPSTIV